jgi:DNA ligase-1
MKVMLAGQFVAEKIQAMLPMYGQPKLDGIRVYGEDEQAFTRSQKLVRSEWVQKIFAEAGPIMNGQDGEIIAGDPTAEDAYRRTNSSVMSYAKPDDVTLHVFDNWQHEGNFEERLDFIHGLKLPSFCTIVPTKLLRTMEEILEYEANLLAEGHEGVILRNPRGYYKQGRASPTGGELIKLKQFADAEARIVGFAELMHNANELGVDANGYAERSSHKDGLVPMDTLGALLCEGVYDNGVKYKVRIGTGFDMALRKEIWDNQIEYLGKLAKFKHFPSGAKEAPRFPVFLGLRDADDLSPVKPKEKEAVQGNLFDL